MILILYKKEIVVSENGTKEIINVNENYTVKTFYDSDSFILEIKDNDACILQAFGNNICLIDKR